MRPPWDHAPGEAPEDLRDRRETAPLVGESPGAERAYRFLVHPRVRATTRERQIEFLEAKKCAPDDIERALAKVAAVGGDEAGVPDASPLESGTSMSSMSSLLGGFAGLFTPLSRITSTQASGDGSDDDDDDDDDDDAPTTRRKRKRRSRWPSMRSRGRFYKNACACCCLCLLVGVPTIAWLLYYFSLDGNVATIVRCLHTRCSR